MAIIKKEYTAQDSQPVVLYGRSDADSDSVFPIVAIPGGGLCVAVLGKTSDSTYQFPRINPETHAINVIDYHHNEIHRGASYFYADSVELNSAATQDYLLTVANTTSWPHMTFLISGSAITTVQVYEATDKSGSSAQTTRNHDRNSSNTSGLAIHKGTSGGTTDGTLIWQRKSGSSSGAARTSSEATHDCVTVL